MSDKLQQMRDAFSGAKKRYNDFNGVISIPEQNYLTKLDSINPIKNHPEMYEFIRVIQDGEYSGDKIKTTLFLSSEVAITMYMQWLKNFGIEGVDDIEDIDTVVMMTNELAENIDNGLEIIEEIDFSIYTSKNGKKYPQVKTLSFGDSSVQETMKEELTKVEEPKKEIKKETKKASKKPALKRKEVKEEVIEVKEEEAVEKIDLSDVQLKLSTIEGLGVEVGMIADTMIAAIEPFAPLSEKELSGFLTSDDIKLLKSVGVSFE